MVHEDHCVGAIFFRQDPPPQKEQTYAETWWTQASCLQLAPDRNGPHKRHISAAYKDAVRTTVKDTEEPLSMRQLIGASAIADADGAVPGLASGKLAREIKHDHGFRYLGNGRKHFENPPALHLTIDGVRGGGEENNIFVAWLPRKRLAGVPPIQVARRFRFSDR